MTEPTAAPNVPDQTNWARALPEAIPEPTTWPAGLAVGVSFIGWGLVASPIILLIGLVLSGVSLAGWIGEMRHDR